MRDAIAALAARHAAIAALRGRFRVAVNQDFTDDDHVLADGDELALIPPVAGGAGADARHVELLGDAAVARPLHRRGRRPGHGRHRHVHRHGAPSQPRRRWSITSSTRRTASMAVREMTRLCDEIEAEIAGTRLAVEHRVGRLAIGDIAVVIAAAAPHRAEAFTACRAMIDRLKDRVPIWKKEVGDDGAEWVGLGP